MTETSHSEQQAKAQYESICDMVRALNCDYDRLEELRDERDGWEVDDTALQPSGYTKEQLAKLWAENNPDDAEELAELEAAAGDCEDQDEARQRIEEDALSVEVRSDWHTPGDEEGKKPGEFMILLCTGGPACRLIGELDDDSEPSRVWMEHQDLGTAWTRYFDVEQETLLTYARCFYFAE